MASAVQICKLALSNIGDKANVQSISPPDATVQAETCASFYPIARDALLELHAWSFNTRREALAEVDNPLDSWAFAYAVPSTCVKPLAILAPESTDDNDSQPFIMESAADGSRVIYTSQEDAVLRYQFQVTDTSKFTPLFVTALSWLLSSYIAGPIVRGKSGAAVARAAYDRFQAEFGKASSSNANSKQESWYENHRPVWISDR